MMLSLALIIGLVCLALLVYPGELTHLGARPNRWLYNRSAPNYQDKWRSAAYSGEHFQLAITDAVGAGLESSGSRQVLDLGCGTGQGLRLLAGSGVADVCYTGVDYSRGMLDEFRKWLAGPGVAWLDSSSLVNEDLSSWARRRQEPAFGAVMMLEVGEFLPEFAAVLDSAAKAIAPGGALVMTRPAGWWWLCFPGRAQSRRDLASAIRRAGLSPPEFVPWRGRYELVFARRPREEVVPA
jgi:SAM-dependent methyltransferase